MKRNSLDNLITWMKNGQLKPMWISGAPEVGKTYLALEFAKMFYEGYFYINLKNNALLRNDFKEYLESEPSSFTEFFAKYYQIPPEWIDKVLLILDDFNDDPGIVKSIEEIIKKKSDRDASKPLVFINTKNPSESINSYVELLELFPMEFDEYLAANDSDWYIEVIKGHFQTQKKIPGIVHKEMLNLFQDYLKTGGMPEAVNDFVTTERIDNVPVIQRKINSLFNAAICNNDEALITKSLQLMNNFPEQLLKSNKKFQYTKIRKGTTHAMYSDALDELVKLHVVNKLDRGDIMPHKGAGEKYTITKHSNQFRLYSADLGLLNAILLSQIPTKTHFNDEFGEEINPYSQILLENYLMQHMKQTKKDVFFWESNSIATIDFVEKANDGIIPYEIRYSNNNRSKSLSVFKNSIESPYSIRLHADNFETNDSVRCIPYYAIFCI